ncbi:hypothetical protein [Burkholderia sp. L27(2015)]|uniref:hypothetical protein n=1 Tax=Burkholderia sp. L27(2015) TaxID=1641858 RepID=UPI00131AA051|nr:hypothetical protein [Burkholderia sp. L27(2015)]
MKLLHKWKVPLRLLVDARTGVFVGVITVAIVIWDHIPKPDIHNEKSTTTESHPLATRIVPANGLGNALPSENIVGNDLRQQSANLETHGNNSPISVNFGAGSIVSPADSPGKARQ